MNVLILNSAQSKYPIGDDSWVQATVKTVHYLAENCDEITLLTSTVPSPWDIVTYLAGELGMRMRLIVKALKNLDGYAEYNRLIKDFNLNETRTEPLFLECESKGHPKKLWQFRDVLAIKRADIIYPVSIKQGGRLSGLLGKNDTTATIRTTFSIDREMPRKTAHQSYEDKTVNPFPSGEWLVHWTRTSQGAWPGERTSDFFRDMLAFPRSYVRSAEKTVCRIVGERMLRGSSWRIAGGESAVSFTSLAPDSAVELMRWRKRYVRYSFEPYGIAIKRQALEHVGAQQVEYEDGSAVRIPSERMFFQSPGEKGEWENEREWRIRGDVRLNEINKEDVMVVVPDEVSMERVRDATEYEDTIHILFSD